MNFRASSLTYHVLNPQSGNSDEQGTQHSVNIPNSYSTDAQKAVQTSNPWVQLSHFSETMRPREVG